MSDIALVTGASGFVGSAVARALVARGLHVRVLMRANANRLNIARLACEPVIGDMRDEVSMTAAMKGARYLFHVAADYRLWARDPREIERNNFQGARATMRIGGKGSSLSGAPLDVDASVVRLAPDARQVVEGWAWPMGDTALLRFGNIDLVATSERLQAINTDIFSAVGIDARAYDAVVVKSAQHFVAAYSVFASKILYVDTPATLFLGADAGRYRNLVRPKWPFDACPFGDDDGIDPCLNND